ncbi:hypothetical protein KVF89_07160 [Nocardioides carbamazepini]|uniref:hypothetical protein n=1 Tax=Nocardioides carbamazepini TaxID=2854259 RepID=UPI00214A224C|nr:hypothetical protein [Nocardioides carbamazepini]MCR1782306.1 hypothetical protein [Nocardioides carbamazepini]
MLPPRRVAVPLVLGIVATAYGWWRVPVPARNRLWAEDGRIFLSDALAGVPPWASYDGYLHLVPRLLAEAVVAVVPPAEYAVATTGAAVATVGLVCALTYVLTEDLIDRVMVRCLVAMVPVLLPSAGFEALGNLANLHGFGLWLGFWLVLHRPQSRSAAAGWAVAGLLVGLTEVVVVLLAPLMLVGWRDRERWLPRGALLAGGLAQVVVSRVQPRPPRGGDGWSPADLVLGFAGQTGSASWTDTGGLAARVVETAGSAGLLVLLVPPAVALAVLVRRGDARHRTLAVGLVSTSTLVWGASVVLNFDSWMTFGSWEPQQWRASGLLRYATTSGLFLCALLVVALDLARVRWQQVLAVGVAVGVLGAALAAGRSYGVARESGEAWPTTRDLVARCEGRPAGSIVVGIAPAAWAAIIPCRAVLGGR